MEFEVKKWKTTRPFSWNIFKSYFLTLNGDYRSSLKKKINLFFVFNLWSCMCTYCKLDWNCVNKLNKLSLFISFDSCHKMMLLESLNIPLILVTSNPMFAKFWCDWTRRPMYYWAQNLVVNFGSNHELLNSFQNW